MASTTRLLSIGGTSGARKSTVARLLARRHGLRCYSTDTATWSHHIRAVAECAASAIAWDKLTPGQRAALPAADQVPLDLDRTRYVSDDINALPDHPPVIVEGTCVVPATASPGSVAVWLTARPGIRACRAAVRGWALQVAKLTSSGLLRCPIGSPWRIRS